MTKEAQNQYVKDALVRNLQKEVSIPEDIGETYRNWVIGLVNKSSAQLIQKTEEKNAKQQGQGGQVPPDQGLEQEAS